MKFVIAIFIFSIGVTPILSQTQAIENALGDRFESSRLNDYKKAIRALDEFDATNDSPRCLAALRETNLDPNLIGRLARIHENWRDFQPGVYYINEPFGGEQVHYFLGIPRTYNRATSIPLVIELPTVDAFVGGAKPSADEVAKICSQWIRDELARHDDAAVLMPLLNLDELWGPSAPGERAAIAPMLHAATILNFDPARVYLFGHSMSAHAAWNLALNYPTYVAAFGALAGSAADDSQRLRLMNLRNVLPVVWHDADDRSIPVGQARQLANVLRKLDCEIDYHETRGIGHVPPPLIVEQICDTMRRRHRELYPKRVTLQSNRLEPALNRNDWLQIDRPLDAGKPVKTFFSHGSGSILIYPATWMIAATINANQIVVTAKNVESVRFFINDQMIDFTQPLIINVNRKIRFSGIVSPSLATMIDQQRALGRGWRYYTAEISIDLTTSTTRP